jgi:predicted nucleotidyltransferase
MLIGPAQRQRIAEICARYHVRKMSLFGSAATGTDGPDSDVDLLVEFVPGEAPSGFALVDMQGELAQAFGGSRIDLAFPTILRNPWRRRAIEPQLQTLYQ